MRTLSEDTNTVTCLPSLNHLPAIQQVLSLSSILETLFSTNISVVLGKLEEACSLETFKATITRCRTRVSVNIYTCEMSMKPVFITYPLPNFHSKQAGFTHALPDSICGVYVVQGLSNFSVTIKLISVMFVKRANTLIHPSTEIKRLQPMELSVFGYGGCKVTLLYTLPRDKASVNIDDVVCFVAKRAVRRGFGRLQVPDQLTPIGFQGNTESCVCSRGHVKSKTCCGTLKRNPYTDQRIILCSG